MQECDPGNREGQKSLSEEEGQEPSQQDETQGGQETQWEERKQVRDHTAS